MTQIIIRADGELPHLQTNIEQLRQKLTDLTPLMEDIGVILSRSSEERFTTKQSPNGNYWANLMPSTVARKGNNNILINKGHLSDIIYQADKYSVSVGTPETYGVFHQFGAKKRNGEEMSARPFLGISDDDERDIFDAINQYLMSD